MRACGAAWGCHAFRHTVTSQLAARGLSAPELAALMGHRDPATTLRFYTHLSTAEVEAIRLKIGGSLGEGSEGGAA
jgi:integrase